MEMAKSLFGSRDHDGYVGKEEHAKKLEASISEDDNELNDLAENLHINNDCIHPKPGGPFSALIPSMWPQDILGKLYSNGDKSVDEDDDDSNKYKYCYDEFGFRIEEEQNEETNKKQNSKSEPDEDEEDRKLLNEPFIEDPQHRLQWIAYLEFSHNNDKNELTWDNIDTLLPHNDKLLNMLIKNGIPHSLRSQLWMRLSGCLKKKLTNSNINYNDIVKETNNNNLIISKQIEKDLLRIMPLNYCFNKINSNGIPRLRRILRSIGWLYPDIGYCQGTGCIVATLLLFLEEEDAFWMMSTIIEDLLPPSYYSSSLLGIQADQLVLQTLINNHLKTIDNLLKNHDIELSLITFNWFLTIFTNCINIKQLLIIWDIFFYNGSIIIFLIILGMLKINEENLLKLNNSADIFNLLSNIPNNLLNIKKLLNIIYNSNTSTIQTNINNSYNININNSTSNNNNNNNNININNKQINYNQLITYNILNTHRHRHLSYLMTDNGILINNKQELLINLPKQYLIKRNLNNKKSYINVLFGGNNTTQMLNEMPLSSSSSSSLSLASQPQQTTASMSTTTININNDNIKYKNIKKTELLVNLHEIIIKISNHFINIEPKLINKIILIPDYTIDSHNMDHENYINVSRIRKRRAKALHDFERHDDDELGFRKNDIITIISQKDEHCWVGELNGLRGWFPAKFVELLDERSKQYSMAGDDGITETITDLVRGTLAPAIKNILEHGMKRPSFLGGPCHPWLFIEEAATREVEKDFDSVYSRLVLCKTYRLDEDGKVLTPEELLYRCVQSINQSHDQAHAQMDVKFRSLICLGLNEQVFHLWLEVLCSCIDIVQKWYKPSSFIYSPGWVQIKCELRLLSQFSFNLNPDWELPLKKTIDSQPLKDGVRDMLVKHHLFSWDL